jgi:hypothetical protein
MCGHDGLLREDWMGGWCSIESARSSSPAEDGSVFDRHDIVTETDLGPASIDSARM